MQTALEKRDWDQFKDIKENEECLKSCLLIILAIYVAL